MQVNFLAELPTSGGYGNIIAAIDAFPKYAFAYPVSSPIAVDPAKIIINIMTRHACLPPVMITDKSSVFLSNLIKAIADVPSITLHHATTKHAQTIGVLEKRTSR